VHAAGLARADKGAGQGQVTWARPLRPDDREEALQFWITIFTKPFIQVTLICLYVVLYFSQFNLETKTK
jgi:hypothetical protein